jgi:hypothetical protein
MSDMFCGFSLGFIVHVDVVVICVWILSTIFDISAIEGVEKKITRFAKPQKNKKTITIYNSFTSRNCPERAKRSLNCGRASYASKSYNTVPSSTHATRYILLFAKNSASSFFAFTRFPFFLMKISFQSMIAQRISSASLKR